VGARVCALRRLKPVRQNSGNRGIEPRLPLNPPLAPPFQGGEFDLGGVYARSANRGAALAQSRNAASGIGLAMT
jgi:hypothetical protein